MINLFLYFTKVIQKSYKIPKIDLNFFEFHFRKLFLNDFISLI